MEDVALVIGYAIISLILFIVVIGTYQWLLYGEIGSSINQTISGGKIYVNGELVAEAKGGGNISMINGTVYQDNKVIYKHRKLYRWEK